MARKWRTAPMAMTRLATASASTPALRAQAPTQAPGRLVSRQQIRATTAMADSRTTVP